MVKLNKGKKVLDVLMVFILTFSLCLNTGTKINTTTESVYNNSKNNSLYAGVTRSLQIHDEEIVKEINTVILHNEEKVIVSNSYELDEEFIKEDITNEEELNEEDFIELESDYVIYKDNKIYESESLSADLQRLVLETSAKYDLPGEVVLALCWRESAYNPKLVSSTNDYGLCQINKRNFKMLNKHFGRQLNYFSPKDSLESCCYLLSNLVKKYGDDDWHYILMCYNMGEGGARKQVRRGNYSTKYSRFILDKAKELGFNY